MMTDKAGDPEPPGGTDPGLAQPAEEDTSAYGQTDSSLADPSAATGDPEPPGNTGDPEPPGSTGGG